MSSYNLIHLTIFLLLSCSDDMPVPIDPCNSEGMKEINCECIKDRLFAPDIYYGYKDTLNSRYFAGGHKNCMEFKAIPLIFLSYSANKFVLQMDLTCFLDSNYNYIKESYTIQDLDYNLSKQIIYSPFPNENKNPYSYFFKLNHDYIVDTWIADPKYNNYLQFTNLDTIHNIGRGKLRIQYVFYQNDDPKQRRTEPDTIRLQDISLKSSIFKTY